MDQDKIVFVKGLVSEDSFSGGLRVKASEVMTVQEMRNRFARSLRIDLGGGTSSSCSVDELRRILSDYRLNSKEACSVRLRLSLDGAKGEIILGETWNVSLEDSLLDILKKRLGPDAINLNYG